MTYSWTGSSDFPISPSAFDTTYNGGRDNFIVKLNAAGSALLYSTFLGGSDDDWDWGGGSDIMVDGSGAAYVTGYTESTDFPITSGAFDTVYNGFWGCLREQTKSDRFSSSLLHFPRR